MEEELPSSSPSQQTDAGLLGLGDYELIDDLFLPSVFDCSTTGSGFLPPGSSMPSTSPVGSSSFSPAFQLYSNGSTKYGEGSAPNGSELVPVGAAGPADPTAGAWWLLSSPPAPAAATMSERLRRALELIKERHGEGELLVQLWVPTRIGDRLVLTTTGQPCSLDDSCERIRRYRSVSMSFNFSADETSGGALGLPGRVFVGGVPEWTPDVRYFTSDEYPRVSYAQYYDVRGSIALPVFEKGARPSCLGVVELVMLARKVNYSREIDCICDALQAVDLRSSEVPRLDRAKIADHSYVAVLPEIMSVLKAVGDAHQLPLAQTWMPCIQQAKGGCRHSDEKYEQCVSTVDSACYVRDPRVQDFHVACSEHHLFRGEGVVGNAFLTNQPCFCPDVAAVGKIRYPLAHHAKLFGLRAAIAIRLRSTRSRNVDFVLEFFLPFGCADNEDQEQLLSSLSITIRRVAHSLRLVTPAEVQQEKKLCKNDEHGISTLSPIEQARPWLYQTPAEFTVHKSEGFSVTEGWNPTAAEQGGCKISELKNEWYDINEEAVHGGAYPSDPASFINYDKAKEQRRSKTEKNISLQDLRKHFAGSLKEAAKNLGVCPTTLKRICRQHGIDRWPSRKIKKVGHSLKKLQTVIDSVHGPQGAVQLSSLYEDFTKTGWSERDAQGNISFAMSSRNEHPESSKPCQISTGRFPIHASESNSRSSSSCSQSSSSSLGRTGQPTMTQFGSAPQLSVKMEASTEDHSSWTHTSQSRGELQVSSDSGAASLTQFQNQGSTEAVRAAPHKDRLRDSFKVKAAYGEEKIIFRLQPTWSFQELKEEIVTRFRIADQCPVDLKYMDDESEWVLLTCDADLQECIDVYKSSAANAIRISVHPSVYPTDAAALGLIGSL